jgi:hypothetical protein
MKILSLGTSAGFCTYGCAAGTTTCGASPAGNVFTVSGCNGSMGTGTCGRSSDADEAIGSVGYMVAGGVQLLARDARSPDSEDR